MANNVFFGSKGLTSTSANYYANMAQELVQALIKKLQNVKFYDVDVRSVQFAQETLPMSIGTKDLKFIKQALIEVGEMNALCAWIREAIKEKDRQLMFIERAQFHNWCVDNDIDLKSPEYPKDALIIVEEDVVREWSVEKRNKYFTLEAMASTFGKYIHPQGAFAKAREDFQNILHNPIVKEGTGADLLLYYRNPSVESEDVESLFLSLQGDYRAFEKELNFMKASLKEEVNKRNLENNNAYQNEMVEYHLAKDEYDKTYRELNSKFKTWQISERERISKLQIIIPQSLEKAFSKVKAACDTSK